MSGECHAVGAIDYEQPLLSDEGTMCLLTKQMRDFASVSEVPRPYLACRSIPLFEEEKSSRCWALTSPKSMIRAGNIRLPKFESINEA